VRFRFNVVTVLTSGITLIPNGQVTMSYPPVFWIIFVGSAIGTALLAFEALKTWGWV
jgi:hypothetical protein